MVVVVLVQALLQWVLFFDAFNVVVVMVWVGDVVERDVFIVGWVGVGYLVAQSAEAFGFVVWWGSVLDIWLLGDSDLVCIELFDDEVECIEWVEL